MVRGRGSTAAKATTPFPYKQLFILGLCRICEPIAFMSIFPYVYYMIGTFNMTDDDKQLAVYAGMVTSAFTLAEFSCAPFWGKISDKIGRKPVIMTGLGGTGLSMLIFGFAPNLYVAILARALGGMLNGNIGVLHTTVAELVTVKEHQPRAYTVMPFVWGLGSIAGPVLGGILAQPVKNYPNLFSDGTIWARFPFLLPNLVCAFVAACSVTIAWLFMGETHPDKKHNRDIGMELGNKLLSCIRRSKSTSRGYEKVQQTPYDSDANLSETDLLMDGSIDESGEALPGYTSTEGTPVLQQTPEAPLPIPELLDLNDSQTSKKETPAPKKAFTRQVVINIAAYGILAYHTITFDQLLPLVLSTDDYAALGTMNLHLPFKFIGGFGLPTSSVGVILMFQGLFSMLSTLLLFPFLARHVGTLNLFRTLAFSYPILYLTAPYILLLPEPFRHLALVPLLVWKCTWSTCSYPALAILLANSAPSLTMLGAINGAAASAAALNRAVGPTVAGWLYSRGLDVGYSILAWWCTAVIACAGAVLSLYLSDKNNRDDMNDTVVDEEAVEVDAEDERRV